MKSCAGKACATWPESSLATTSNTPGDTPAAVMQRHMRPARIVAGGRQPKSTRSPIGRTQDEAATRISPKVRLKPEPVWERINRRNMSQNDLARRAKISSGYLSQLLSGQKSPSPDVRQRLQATLEISQFDDLFVLEYPDD